MLSLEKLTKLRTAVCKKNLIACEKRMILRVDKNVDRSIKAIIFLLAFMPVMLSSLVAPTFAQDLTDSLSLQDLSSLKGWGGYIISKSQVDSVLSDLSSRGYTAVRYEAVPQFLSSTASHRINYDVLDYLISEATSVGITVIIDPIHNWPPSTSTTLQARFSDWLTELRSVASRYNSKSNVILQCVNEYTLSDASQKFQTITTDLRTRGITLPLHFNYMWDSVGKLIPPQDPLKKITIGHHIYGDHDTDSSYMKSGETWLQYCTRIGLEDRMQKMFTSTDSTWFGYALSHGTTVLLTEVGGSNKAAMTPYNVAYIMRTFEYSQKYSVGMIGFRVGDYSNLKEYELKAEEYFNRQLFYATVVVPPSPSPTPTPTPTTSPTSLILQDGFESMSLSSWSDITTTYKETATINSYTPYEGNYHARFSTTGNSYEAENAFLTKTTSSQEIYARAYFRFSSYKSSIILRDNGDSLYLIRFTNNGQETINAGIKREYGVNKWVLYANGAKTASTVTVSMDRYYNVELYWNAVTRTAELYINGERILQTNTSGISSTNIVKVDMGLINTNNVQNSLILYADKTRISNTYNG